MECKQRWVNQFNFYLKDARWGRMFVQHVPYFPFSARVCLNQHHWLAIRLREEGIEFQQSTNAFLKYGNPARLQELADSLTTRDLVGLGVFKVRIQQPISPAPPRELQESVRPHFADRFFSQYWNWSAMPVRVFRVTRFPSR
ncbi:MAG: hypothetical protein IT167_15500 [Bryobacterales bacterium]|nr:hypothetical protein [Bryobacterales bacterium]